MVARGELPVAKANSKRSEEARPERSSRSPSVAPVQAGKISLLGGTEPWRILTKRIEVIGVCNKKSVRAR